LRHWRSSAGIMLIKIEVLIIYELLFEHLFVMIRSMSNVRSLVI
jgi:hypothetical protein